MRFRFDDAMRWKSTITSLFGESRQGVIRSTQPDDLLTASPAADRFCSLTMTQWQPIYPTTAANDVTEAFDARPIFRHFNFALTNQSVTCEFPVESSDVDSNCAGRFQLLSGQRFTASQNTSLQPFWVLANYCQRLFNQSCHGQFADPDPTAKVNGTGWQAATHVVRHERRKTCYEKRNANQRPPAGGKSHWNCRGRKA